MEDRIVTCVYCGFNYPEGTPTSKTEVLTEHIKICEKHPMRQAEGKIIKLRKALIGLVGVETKADLTAMEFYLRSASCPDQDKIAMINAIHTLMDIE